MRRVNIHKQHLVGTPVDRIEQSLIAIGIQENKQRVKDMSLAVVTTFWATQNI